MKRVLNLARLLPAVALALALLLPVAFSGAKSAHAQEAPEVESFTDQNLLNNRDYMSRRYHGDWMNRRFVVIDNDSYYPYFQTVRRGNFITWVNRDNRPHTVTSVNGRFDSGPIYPGQSFTIRLNRPGTYYYYCRIHPEMRGSLRVYNPYFYGYGWNR